jgi:hypothetical protein
MTNREIFAQAAHAADDATAAKYGDKYPTNGNATGDYWKLVYEATAAHLMRQINGTY